jgi:hypothetical protein
MGTNHGSEVCVFIFYQVLHEPFMLQTKYWVAIILVVYLRESQISITY